MRTAVIFISLGFSLMLEAGSKKQENIQFKFTINWLKEIKSPVQSRCLFVFLACDKLFHHLIP
jgi:hypothetical protein